MTAEAVRSIDAALEAHYRFLLWLVPTVDGFPRTRSSGWGAGSRAPPWTFSNG